MCNQNHSSHPCSNVRWRGYTSIKYLFVAMLNLQRTNTGFLWTRVQENQLRMISKGKERLPGEVISQMSSEGYAGCACRQKADTDWNGGQQGTGTIGPLQRQQGGMKWESVDSVSGIRHPNSDLQAWLSSDGSFFKCGLFVREWPSNSRKPILFRLGYKGKCICTKQKVWNTLVLEHILDQPRSSPSLYPAHCPPPISICGFVFPSSRKGLAPGTDIHSGRRKREMYCAVSIFRKAQSPRNPWWISSCSSQARTQAKQ